jgi:glycosyltransferase involved in cell wall biosynthesis
VVSFARTTVEHGLKDNQLYLPEKLTLQSQTMSVVTSEAAPVEFSIVIPCLNEAETLEVCIKKAQRALQEHNIIGEVIVADNGSTDGCQEIAKRLCARVVNVPAKGYGNALMAGIVAARGKFVLMGDADDSYDFLEAPRFLAKLREGFDLVQGCRLPVGGGTVRPGAMPWSHRWIGNPGFSLMARWMFHAPIHDAYCGLRAFTKELFNRLDLRCTGMEFATEMILKSGLNRVRISEVPITLHKDGRVTRSPHLRTLRDGWRTLRLYLLFSPRWLFAFPGLLLILLGLAGYALALPGVTIRGATFDAHTLLFASLAMLMGYQAVLFGIFAKTLAVNEGLLPKDPGFTRFYQLMNLERALVLGVLAFAVGVALLFVAACQWRAAGFGPLEYARTMRLVVPGVTLSALGFQTILSGFFVSILGLSRR